MTRLPTGSLVITLGAQGPHYEGKFRWQGRQCKRRLGPAWLLYSPKEDGWIKRPGRAQEGFLSERDAYQALTAMIADHAAQEAQEREPMVLTFAQAAESWQRRAIKRQRKPSTLATYRDAVRLVESAPFADKPISAVSKRDMKAWFDSMEHGHKRERLLKFAKGICIHAISEEWITENVANAVDSQPILSDGSYDYFDAAEIERLIAAAADPYDAALYATAAFTGLRRGELLALQWQDIDFEHARLVVRQNLSHGQLLTPKSGKVRVVPLIPPLGERLKALKSRSSGFFKSTRMDLIHVFANPKRARTGLPWANPAATGVRYRAALKRAKLRSLPFHSLRHSFGSHAVNVASLVQVKSWLGHADLRTTGRYLHARNLDSDASLLAAAFE
jgi:integrase